MVEVVHLRERRESGRTQLSFCSVYRLFVVVRGIGVLPHEHNNYQFAQDGMTLISTLCIQDRRKMANQTMVGRARLSVCAAR